LRNTRASSQERNGEGRRRVLEELGNNEVAPPAQQPEVRWAAEERTKMTAKIISFPGLKTQAQTPVQLSNVLVEPASDQPRRTKITTERFLEVQEKLRAMEANGDSDEFGLIKRWTEICDRAKEQYPLRQRLVQITAQITKAYKRLISRKEKLDEASEQLDRKNEQLDKELEALPTAEEFLRPIDEFVADFEHHYETK
jgi:hypothetical protein